MFPCVCNLPIEVSNVFILAILFDEINKKVKMLNVKFKIVFTKRLMSGILCHTIFPIL